MVTKSLIAASVGPDPVRRRHRLRRLQLSPRRAQHLRFQGHTSIVEFGIIAPDFYVEIYVISDQSSLIRQTS